MITILLTSQPLEELIEVLLLPGSLRRIVSAILAVHAYVLPQELLDELLILILLGLPLELLQEIVLVLDLGTIAKMWLS